MRKLAILTIAAGITFFGGCDTVTDSDQDNLYKDPFQPIEWEEDVTGQLLPFALIQNPGHFPANEIDYLDDNELVFITKTSGSVFAYPLRFMGVEVVNENIDGVLTAVTYCPLTRSAIAWNRILGSDTLLLTASGYLLRDNLMPLDLNSGSIWSQMRLVGMRGKHDKMIVETVPLFETSWKTVKTYFPDAAVFTNESLQKSSSEGNYYSFGEGFTGRQFGILSRDNVELFNVNLFSGGINLYSTFIQPGGSVVVAGSSELNYITAFRTSYTMQPVQGEFPIIMRDETGTDWNVFGEAVEGEREGEQLESPVFYIAADWAWELLLGNTSVFNPS
jgi:hypothetical protein